MSLPVPLPLASVLDTAAAGPLRLALRKSIAEGEPVFIDGSAVEQAGLACLQVLVAAKAAALEARLVFLIAGASEVLVGMARLAGLDDLVAA